MNTLRVDRRKAQRDALRRSLPDNVATPDQERQMAVWYNAEARYLDAFREDLVMSIFTDLEPVEDKYEKRAQHDPGPEILDELGLRVKQFADFCDQQVRPLIQRLERGLTLIAACPLTEAGDQRHAELTTLWCQLRADLRHMLPVAWSLAGPAAHLYMKLPEQHQRQAEALWGPLYMPGQGNFGPLWRGYWPADAIEALDQTAKLEGFWPLTEERPTPGGRPREARKA